MGIKNTILNYLNVQGSKYYSIITIIMKILLINYGMHNKNLNAIKKYTKVNIDIINDLQNIDITNYDIVYSPSEPIDVSNFPDKKFIFGPHFSTFPNHKIKPIINKNSI